jgi:hypothetical protein
MLSHQTPAGVLLLFGFNSRKRDATPYWVPLILLRQMAELVVSKA